MVVNSRLHSIIFVLVLFAVLVPCVFGGTYTVKSGDSLTKIAERELGDIDRWREIAGINGIKPPYTLTVGQTLQLPDAERHISYDDDPEAADYSDWSETEDPRQSLNLSDWIKENMPPGGWLLGTGAILLIVYVFSTIILWAVSMRLNCNIMIMPEVVPFNKCLRLSVIHTIIWIAYMFGVALLNKPIAQHPVTGVALIVVYVIFLVWLVLLITKRTAGIGWLWAFLFIVFSWTVCQLIMLMIILGIAIFVICIGGIMAIF